MERNISKLLATEEEFVFQGRTWRLAAATFEVQAEWENWLQRQAMEKLRGLRASMDEDDYRRDRADLIDRIGAGEYSFMSPVSARAMTGARAGGPLSAGFRQMLRIRLRPSQPDVTDEIVWAMAEQEWSKLCDLMEKMDANPHAPPTGGAGSATTQPST